MKKIIKKIFILFIFSNLLFASNVSEQNLNKLVKLSGINEQISQIPSGVISMTEQYKGKIPEEVFKKLNDAFTKSFNASKMMNIINKSLKNSISNVTAKKLLKWYESPLAKEITQAEINGSKASSYIHAMQNAKQLLSNKELIHNVEKILQTFDIVEKQMNFEENMFLYAYAAGAFANGEVVTHKEIKAVKETFESMKDKRKQKFGQDIKIIFANTYQNIPNSKIQQYINFLSKENTKHFNKTITDAMYKAMQKSGQNMIDILFNNDKNLKK